MKSEANKLLLATIRKLLRRDGARSQLNQLLERTHPADLAYVFHFLDTSRRSSLFASIERDELAAAVLSEIDPGPLRAFLPEVDPRRLVRLLELMSSDDTADVLALIDDEERKELILTMMHRDELATTQSLMEYDPESAGGLMATEFLTLEESTTAREALERIQEDGGRAEVVFYLYVVNEHGHLVGVISLRSLVLAAPGALLREFMITDLIRVDVSTDQEEVARLIARYDLLALPVVDGNQLVGVVTVDDIIDVIRSEATEDMMLMAGAGDRRVDMLRSSALASARARLPWMLPTFIGGALAMVLLWSAHDRLHAVLPSLVLIPLMMMMAGNVGTQSAAIVTRGLALGRINFAALRWVVLGELAVGALAGLVWGSLTSAISWSVLGPEALISGPLPLRFSLIAGGSMAASLALSAALGALLPMLFSRFDLDPAIATGPLVTTIVDVGAVAITLGALTAMT